jgi:hypothetical protein
VTAGLPMSPVALLPSFAVEATAAERRRFAILGRTDGRARGPSILRGIRKGRDAAPYDHRGSVGLPRRTGSDSGFILGVAVRSIATLDALCDLWIGLYRHPVERPWEFVFLAIAQG